MASARMVMLLAALSLLGTCSCFNVPICDKVCVRARRDASAAAERDVAAQLRTLVEHYKGDDPVGIPGAPIPDPVDVPDMKRSFTVTTMEFKKVKVFGLSKFRFQRIKLDLAALQAEVGVTISTLLMAGQYTLGGWFSRNAGPFTVTLNGVLVEGVATLEVDRKGHLEAQNIHLDIKFESIKLDFQNLGGAAFVFQGIINSVGTFLFDSVKPFILSEVNKRLLTVINENIGQVPQTFPNSIPPLDMAIAEMRREVRMRGFDPYLLRNYTVDYGGAALAVSHLHLTGLSSFYRVGDVSVEVLNHTANATLQVATQRLKGSCNWHASLGWLSRSGRAEFWSDYLQARVSVLQSMNVQRRPRIERLQMTVGNLQTRVQGSGTLDYVAEFVLNVLPNIIRYQLVTLAEEPLRQKIQDRLDQVDVEELVLKQIDAMEKKRELDDGQPQPVTDANQVVDEISYDD